MPTPADRPSPPGDSPDGVHDRDPVDGHSHGDRLRVRRRRRRRSAFFRYVVKPPLELVDSLRVLFRGSFLTPAAITALLAIWWLWPWIGRLPGTARRGPQEVITTFVEDPQRTIGALTLWRQRPGSLLVLQGRPSSQVENRAFLVSQDLWPRDERGLLMLTPGCDSVGQIAALERLLRPRRTPGRLTVVTSPAHLARTQAIAQILLGSRGWAVEALPVMTGDNRPESLWRTVRDQARAQLIRTFDWDPAAEVVCRSREGQPG